MSPTRQRRRYPKYKDSGIEWLGEIPEGWGLKRLKYLVGLLTQKTDSYEIKLGLENIESATGRYLETDSKFDGDGVQFQAGDILCGKLRPYLAKVLLAEWNGLAVGDFFVLRPKPDVSPEYLQHRLLEPTFTNLSDGSTFGAKMPRVGWEFMGDLKFSLPDISEQQTIAAFLDRETTRIDGLITKKQRQIELLQEKRAALISHAVTKGLDPNVKMKDSGIQWLGEIPEGWEARSLRRLVLFVKTGGTPVGANEDSFEENGFNWFTPGDFSEKLRLTAAERKLSEHGRKEVRLFPPMTVMMVGIGATIGKVSLSDQDCSCNQQINGIVCGDKLNPVFATYCLRTLRNFIVKCGKFTTLPIINQEETKNLFVPVPPIDEQHAIAAFLDRETARIDGMIEKVEESIDLLREYRTALISAAVTGKIDVRGKVAQ